MSQPATLAWLARHELDLAWRDWLSMMTAGNRRREPVIWAAIVVFVAFVHLLAYVIVAPVAMEGIETDKSTLVFVTGMAFLSWSLMLSQAIESVTRAFYSRADLDLILSSPVAAHRVFAVRIGAISLSVTLMAAALAAPFINVLVVCDGIRWLAAYAVLAAMGAISTALAVAATVGMFVSIGPRRTRLIAQVVAAIVGASFVIGIQAVAILSYGNYSRLAVFRSDAFVAWAPGEHSLLWAPARAAMGEPFAFAAFVGLAALVLLLAIRAFAPRFANHVITASGTGFAPGRTRAARAAFRPASIKRALRRKEWTLLRRDPWLVSQALMQVLYLLPPALLLWRYYGDDIGPLVILVPVLVMAAGQLGGGLAWLAVSGEDAPDLVGSAPITQGAIIRAKFEAILGAVAMVTAPLLAALALAAPYLALVAAIGIAVSSLSATLIQVWFRAQARRSAFRRRHTSSRVATFGEAFSSILWAGTAGLAAAESWIFAALLALCALFVLAVVRAIRPRGEPV